MWKDWPIHNLFSMSLEHSQVLEITLQNGMEFLGQPSPLVSVGTQMLFIGTLKISICWSEELFLQLEVSVPMLLQLGMLHLGVLLDFIRTILILLPLTIMVLFLHRLMETFMFITELGTFLEDTKPTLEVVFMQWFSIIQIHFMLEEDSLNSRDIRDSEDLQNLKVEIGKPFLLGSMQM